MHLEDTELGIKGEISALEMVSGAKIKTDNNKIFLSIPANRTQVIQILQ